MRGSDQLIRPVDTRVIAMVDNLMETSAATGDHRTHAAGGGRGCGQGAARVRIGRSRSFQGWRAPFACWLTT